MRLVERAWHVQVKAMHGMFPRVRAHPRGPLKDSGLARRRTRVHNTEHGSSYGTAFMRRFTGFVKSFAMPVEFGRDQRRGLLSSLDA
jgi:hypothetical protein